MERPKWMPRNGGHGLVVVLPAFLAVSGAAVAALPARDPNWPCQQQRVAQLSFGALWDGPSLDPYATRWSDDAEVAALATRVTRRRLAVVEAEQAASDFARAADKPRALALAAGIFALLDAERGQVMAGLDRFGARQKQLAVTIRADMERLRSHQQGSEEQALQAQGAGQTADQLGWETRVFEQRRQALSTACDVPNLIERRLGALLRAIAAGMGARAP